MPLRDKLRDVFLVNRRPLRLPRIIRKRIRDAEPRKPVYDILFKLRLVALLVGVLKTQEHYPAAVCGKEIVKKGRPHRADMQKPRRAWRKPRNNLLRHTKNYTKYNLILQGVLSLTRTNGYAILKGSQQPNGEQHGTRREARRPFQRRSHSRSHEPLRRGFRRRRPKRRPDENLPKQSRAGLHHFWWWPSPTDSGRRQHWLRGCSSLVPAAPTERQSLAI